MTHSLSNTPPWQSEICLNASSPVTAGCSVKFICGEPPRSTQDSQIRRTGRKFQMKHSGAAGCWQTIPAPAGVWPSLPLSVCGEGPRTLLRRLGKHSTCFSQDRLPALWHIYQLDTLKRKSSPRPWELEFHSQCRGPPASTLRSRLTAASIQLRQTHKDSSWKMEGGEGQWWTHQEDRTVVRMVSLQRPNQKHRGRWCCLCDLT